MTSKKAKVFLMADPLIQLHKKYPDQTCEMIEVYEHLMSLCDRDNMEPVDNIRKPTDPYMDVPIGNCSACGKLVSMDDMFCSRCGQRLDWRHA